MKFLVIFVVLLVVGISFGEDAKQVPKAYEIPDEFEEEFFKILQKIISLDLPTASDRMHPDICKITDAATKKMVMDFIVKVNAAGGNLPKPNC